MLGRSGGIEEDTEEKAKAVAAAWETELIQFLATLAIFHQVQFILFFKSSWSKIASGARIESILSPKLQQ